MSARIKKADEIKLAREFLDHVYDMIEDGDDTVYELLDPECKYGDELLRRLNNDTIREILALGFRAKYGEDWHEPVRNYEVGTVEEQMKRQYDTMCNTTKACPDSDWSCKECFAKWAQMPYGEPKAKGD